MNRQWMLLAVLAVSGCQGIDKATFATGNPSGNQATTPVSFNQCPASDTFKLHAYPVLQNQCMSCHASTSKAAFSLTMDPDNKESIALANYLSAKGKISITAPAATISAHALFFYSSGNNGHTKILDPASPDFASIQGWIDDEIARPCGSSSESPTPAPTVNPDDII